ncbi:hypothetical protein [Micrococcus sp. HOU01]|uniref:hypothetical protein n=1 Tax=Micrococcus sp. HOU01 TaxID=3101753 RepID=UPI002D77328A|nr:hypothetical protein [Micrococcus sp. HOU1]WRQ42642.1 hypothetical protein SOY78_06265 [Micrococcus sp. HOU1]
MRLDRASHAALRVLTSNGASVAEAVRAAITEAAERFPEPPIHDERDLTYDEWIAAQVAAAPPPTDYQIYAITVAFVDQQDTWLSEEQWAAARDGSQDERAA